MFMFPIADVVTATRNVFNSLPPGLQRDYVAQNQFSHQLMGALAPSTLNTKYIPAWSKYAEWLASYHIRDPISGTTENTVAAYLSHLITVASNRNTGDYAIQMATAAIQFKFNSLGREGPVSSPYIELLKRSASRMLHPSRSCCEPIAAQDLHKMLQTHLTATCSLKVRMHLTVFLIMFLGLFRFDDVKQILVHRDFLRFIPSKSGSGYDGVLFFIPHSKTDQEWKGNWVAIGATHTRYCPVKLLLSLLAAGAYCTFSNSLDVGPLLRAVAQRHQPNRLVLAEISAPFSDPIKPLSYSTFRESILCLSLSASITKHIGLHSARIGGASAAAENNIDSRLVCGLGRWKQGTTFADEYIKMMEGNAQKYFKLTKSIWPY